MESAVQESPAAEPAPEISAIHDMLSRIERQTDAHDMNRVINHPEVIEWVRHYAIGRLDVSQAVQHKQNVLLMGEHGGLLFESLRPGVYEVHTAVLPAGRGAWAALMARTCLHIMFTRADAFEIVTRVPKGNLGARALTKMCGFEFEFTRSAQMHGWVYQQDPIPADVFSLPVMRWQRTAPGLVERGRWFHQKLEQEYKRLGKVEPPHPADDTHDRYVGSAVEMIFGGNTIKGIELYNRWAAMAGYATVSVVSIDPLTIDIQQALLCFKGDDFWVMTCR